jgi:hypothetical protein
MRDPFHADTSVSLFYLTLVSIKSILSHYGIFIWSLSVFYTTKNDLYLHRKRKILRDSVSMEERMRKATPFTKKIKALLGHKSGRQMYKLIPEQYYTQTYRYKEDTIRRNFYA